MTPAGDMPTMLASNYANNTYSAGAVMDSAAFLSAQSANQQAQWGLDSPAVRAELDNLKRVEREARLLKSLSTSAKEIPAVPSRRIVQVYIADPSEAVPLADSVLFTGEQKMTDLTDQELFFEIDIRAILQAHNAKRAKIVNKAIKDRTEFLEPAKVRDLKMVVVTVASF